MSWTVAMSLQVLRTQVNQAYPKRSKASDGTIGDAAHSKTRSDHNPNGRGVVCALDLTHDPANGFDAHALAELQRTNPHPQLKYIVSKGRIASRKHGWRWRDSSGHFSHVHFSVGVGPDGSSLPGTYESTELWNIGGQVMSADRLTKEEVIELHVAYYGGPPGKGYDFRHVGGPLQKLIHDFKPSPQTLVNRVNAKQLIKPSDCPNGTFDKDALYTEQLLATKKVFGK